MCNQCAEKAEYKIKETNGRTGDKQSAYYDKAEVKGVADSVQVP